MFTKASLLTALLASFLFTVACNEPAEEGSPTTRPARGEARFNVGWHNMRGELDAREVLDLLGHPKDIRVDRVTTYWFYSDRDVEGPHVAFATRTSRVRTWLPPKH